MTRLPALSRRLSDVANTLTVARQAALEDLETAQPQEPAEGPQRTEALVLPG
jgi:hypothetical protein